MKIVCDARGASHGRDFKRHLITAEKSSEKISQLVEVIRACEMYILTDVNFITFPDIANAKAHYRNILPQSCAFAYMACGCNDNARQPAQTYQNQVWMLSLGGVNSVSFMSGYLNAVAIYFQQILYAVACLFNIIHDEDGQTRAIFFIHKLSLLILNYCQPGLRISKDERLEDRHRQRDIHL